VKSALVETLGFLSEDDYAFTFTQNEAPRRFDGYLEFGSDESFHADEVILFSGGLDSLAGALNELISHGQSVALVSHQSSTKISRVQKHLVGELENIAGSGRILHVPITAQLRKGSHRETTHRVRSFLFAALGMATARMFDRDRLRFYENGVISLNLPPVGQVVGARATRTTHPQTLAGFSRLFTAIFERAVRVENPFFWKTKREVVEVIAQHGAAYLISAAHSCAHVYERSLMKPHCGRCSQCIDRRFAVLAAGLATHDPEEAYAVDLMRGSRADVRDREIALAYLRHARQLRALLPTDFMIRFGEASRALQFFDEPPAAVARRIYELHRRHGETVSAVMDQELITALTAGGLSDAHPDCLLRLAGPDVFGQSQPAGIAPVRSAASSLPTSEQASAAFRQNTSPRRIRLNVVDAVGKIEIVGLGSVTGVSAMVFVTLAERYLEAAGEGRELADYPLLRTVDLVDRWRLSGEEVVRRRIARARRKLAEMAVASGWPESDVAEIIENLPWKGYRLNPFLIRVFKI
jgi:7-cyano-7-deazaguanine synthase in queuosine biosynthesis